ncbi:MAG: sulfate adenylyltransferase [bacterium]
MDLVAPHGGKLIDRVLKGDERAAAIEKSKSLRKLPLNATSVSDLELISIGACSPLTGFMKKADYESVVENIRLANGIVWSIPITLAVSRSFADELKDGEEILLTTEGDTPLAIMRVEERFTYDKEREAKKVYKTTEEAHPGVARLLRQGEVLLGGDIQLINHVPDLPFEDFRHEPAVTRRLFKERGWKTVVAFQTRNPIHRAHEYLTKVALESVDGLLIHPLVGETKSDDIPSDVRMQCYKIMMEQYYNPKRVMLSVFPAAMRYAGPREAIFHAMVRKNYGCSHLIVGRDHAGVGSYYGTYEAQEVFEQFTPDELGIVPLKFEHAFYCKRTRQMATDKTSPSSEPHERLFLSGTKVREMLSRGELPPEEFTRPEVAKVLIESYKRKS